MREFPSQEILGDELPQAKGIGQGIFVKTPTTWSVPDIDGYNFELVIVAVVPTVRGGVGQLMCESLRVSTRRKGFLVNIEGIRNIPLAEMVTSVARKCLIDEPDVEGRSMSAVHAVMTPELAVALKSGGPTDDALKWVARIYREEYVVRGTPTKAVAVQLGLKPPTASDWIRRARRKGFLGASEGPGRAGG